MPSKPRTENSQEAAIHDRKHSIRASLAIGSWPRAWARHRIPRPYEPLPILKASDFLPPSMLKGPDLEVEEKVTSDGVFNTYTINSAWANYRPRCTSIAMIRIHEIGAIAQLKEVDKMAVGAGAVVDSVATWARGPRTWSGTPSRPPRASGMGSRGSSPGSAGAPSTPRRP